MIVKNYSANKKTATHSIIKLGNGLILINLLSLTLIVVFLFIPLATIRPILAVPFLMIFPGYTLLAAIFPKRTEISCMERLIFSIGLSIVLAILFGLFLNSTPWGISVESALYTLSALIFTNSIIAWLRLSLIPKSQRFSFYLDLSWLKQQRFSINAFFSIILIIAISGSLYYMTTVLMKPGEVETYSEFYLLGQQGDLYNYPDVLVSGQQGRVRIGINNHEGREVHYTVKVTSNDGIELTNLTQPVILSDGQDWEKQVNFLATTPGEDKKIEFTLFREGDESPYRKLHLRVDVIS